MIQQQGRRSGKFGSACIIEMLVVHFQLTKPAKKIARMCEYKPTGGFALALAAVSNNLFHC
jgi:hypothetical protein